MAPEEPSMTAPIAPPMSALPANPATPPPLTLLATCTTWGW